MNELFEYVKITQNNEGYVTVEVVNKDPVTAQIIFINMVTKLNRVAGISTPKIDELETKATNENTKLMPTVTVKGRGEQVVQKYLLELDAIRKADQIQ